MEATTANENMVKMMDSGQSTEQTAAEQSTEQTAAEQTATQTTAQMVEQMMDQAIPGTNAGDTQTVTLEEDGYSDFVKSMIQNTLKLMRGANGGGFYIRFVLDEGTCYSWLNLIIVYPEGYFKSLLLYKDYLKETDVESSNGVHTIERKYRRTKGYQTIPFWDEDPSQGNYESLKHYETPTMPIPERALWAKIQENYHKIPLDSISHTVSIQQLIIALQEWAVENAQLPECGFMDNSDKCYIEADDFRSVVEANGWTVAAARTQLDLLGVFDKDKSARGYQKTKRVGTSVKRFYVIKKIRFTGQCRPKYLKNTDYNASYTPRLVVLNRHLQKEIEKVTDRCNKLIKKYEPDAEFVS